MSDRLTAFLIALVTVVVVFVVLYFSTEKMTSSPPLSSITWTDGTPAAGSIPVSSGSALAAQADCDSQCRKWGGVPECKGWTHDSQTGHCNMWGVVPPDQVSLYKKCLVGCGKSMGPGYCTSACGYPSSMSFFASQA